MDMQFETKLVQLTDSIWAIDQEMVRAYIVVGTERALVLDFGVCPCEFLSLVRQVTSLPLVAVLTHADGDHTANIGCFDEVLLHPAEIPLLGGYTGTCTPIEERDIIDLGGRSLLVLHLPGHTPGSIALLDTASGELLSGDTVSHTALYLFGRGRCITDYRDSLERLARFPVQTIWPAHGPAPVAPDAIDGLLALTESVMRGEVAGQPNGQAHMPERVKLYVEGDCSFYF